MQRMQEEFAEAARKLAESKDAEIHALKEEIDIMKEKRKEVDMFLEQKKEMEEQIESLEVSPGMLIPESSTSIGIGNYCWLSLISCSSLSLLL